MVLNIIFSLMMFCVMFVNVVIGSLYLNDCKADKYIPIFLLVAGIFGFVKGILNVVHNIKNRQFSDVTEGVRQSIASEFRRYENIDENPDEDPVEHTDEGNKAKLNPIDLVFNCFLFAWTIAGSVWVYSSYKPEFIDKDADDYCNEVCFTYAFWFLIIAYLVMTCRLYLRTNIWEDLQFEYIKASKDCLDCWHRISTMVCYNQVSNIISIIILLTFPIWSLVIGSLYLDDCKVEKYIPIFLLVAGVFGTVKGILKFGLYIKYRNKEDTSFNQFNLIDKFLSCLLFSWSIPGSVWVFGNYKPEFSNTDAEDYCHEACYMYAFVLLTITYIIMGFVLPGHICCYLKLKCKRNDLPLI